MLPADLKADVTLHMPANIGDYTDFYASKEHASNCGEMYRGKGNELNENWYDSSSHPPCCCRHRQLNTCKCLQATHPNCLPWQELIHSCIWNTCTQAKVGHFVMTLIFHACAWIVVCSCPRQADSCLCLLRMHSIHAVTPSFSQSLHQTQQHCPKQCNVTHSSSCGALTSFRCCRGQIFDKQAGATAPQCGPCQKLDIELEMVITPLPLLLGAACSERCCRAAHLALWHAVSTASAILLMHLYCNRLSHASMLAQVLKVLIDLVLPRCVSICNQSCMCHCGTLLLSCLHRHCALQHLILTHPMVTLPILTQFIPRQALEGCRLTKSSTPNNTAVLCRQLSLVPATSWAALSLQLKHVITYLAWS